MKRGSLVSEVGEEMVFRRMLGAKLHGARVTEARLDYEGSITIDEDLLDLAGIKPYEFVLVSNMMNGERFETYAIPGPRGSGAIGLNGATARKGLPGDRVIIFTHCLIPEDEMGGHKPKVVVLSTDNKPAKIL